MMTRKQKLAIVAVAALVGPCIALAQPPAPAAGGRGPAPAGAPAPGAGAGPVAGVVGAPPPPGYQGPLDGAGNVAIPPRETEVNDLAKATPANSAAGIYRGKVTSGPDAGTELSLWVIRAKDDTVRLMPSRLVLDDQDMQVKFDGTNVVQAAGDVQLKIDPTSEPKKLEYKLGAVTYTAELVQTLGVDF